MSRKNVKGETVSIFGQRNAAAAAVPGNSAAVASRSLVSMVYDPDSVVLSLEQIEIREQVRKHFDEDSIRELAANIEQHGLLQPIVVSPIEDGPTGPRFLLISGERRYRAHQFLRREKIRATVRRKSGDDNASNIQLLQLAENDKREDLSKVEVARAIASLQQHTGWSDKDVATKMHRSRSWVVLVRSVLTAPEAVQRAIAAKTISWHAWANDGATLSAVAEDLPSTTDPETLAAAYRSTQQLAARDGVSETGSARQKGRKGETGNEPKDRAFSMPLADAKGILKTLQKVAAKHKVQFDVPKNPDRKEILELMLSLHRKIARAL